MNSTVHPQVAGSADFNSIDLSAVRVLSLDGVLEGGTEEKKLTCLLSDGRLLVAQGHEFNSHVLSYRARLERLKQPFRIVPANIETIDRIYYQGTIPSRSGRNEKHSVMQTAAKDLLAKACSARASDIHIRVKNTSTELYFRVHNDLMRVGGYTREYGERLLATMYAAMTSVSDNAYKPTERQDASIADRDKLPEGLYGVRIATAPTGEGNVMVLRLLYNDAGEKLELERLGFSPTQAALLQRLKEQPIGMNIISGPTGSGKSTTLQRVLAGEILEAQGRLHVLTVEDPVEYPIEGAVQTAITNASSEEDRARLFSAAISNAMRLDPDVIMVGEVRDRASGQNALRAAMTGHQVWTTVHANGAMGIVDRLVDLGLPLSLVADHSVVTGLISQRLVKVLCPDCRRPLAEHAHELPEAMLSRLRRVLPDDFGQACVAGEGCEHCNYRGTIGRSVVAEVILPDEQFFEHVRAGDKGKAVQYWREALGGRTILEHAIEKVAAGLVDPRTAEKVVGHLHLSSGVEARRHARLEAIRAV